MMRSISRSVKRGLSFSMAVLMTTMALAQAPSEAANNITINPSQFSFSTGRNDRSVQNVTITNQGNKPMQIKLYLGDWLRDSLGNHAYFEPGTITASCSPWLSLSQSFVEVPANGSASFTLTLATPDADSVEQRMRWSMLFVELAEEKSLPSEQGKGVRTVMAKKQRFGLHVYHNPTAVTRKEMRMVDFRPVDAAKRLYRVTLKNTGATQLSCQTYVELTSLTDADNVRKIDGDNFPMFPGQTRQVDIVLPKDVVAGKYNVMAAADAGEDVPLEAAQQELDIQ
ncbi:MAG: hypothetical protein EOP49_39190 [Sphingobacteriales bacterium]|nr:MAG: hypothetical protein EOP49_39190 [Sphingobacteriales bacterium]